MAARDVLEIEGSGVWLATIPATHLQRRRALLIVCLLLAAFVAAVPLAPIRLLESSGFIPSVQAIIFVADLVTAVLLFTQFSFVRSHGLLVLACGYLFTALIVIPHTLTFPGALTPQGLLGAGLQTTGWLHITWHFGFPATVIGYTLIKDSAAMSDETQASAASAIGWSVTIVVSLVCAIVWILIAADEYVPRLFLDRTTFSPLVYYTGLFDTTVCGIALLLLWTKQTSVLDQWLLVALFATLLEMVMVTFFLVGRFDVGWYSVRVFGVVASTTVLIALLTETTRLYARLVLTVRALKREGAVRNAVGIWWRDLQ